MYAIVKTGGKQYRVERGQRLLIERLAVEEVGRTAASALLLDESGEVVRATPRTPAPRRARKAPRRPARTAGSQSGARTDEDGPIAETAGRAPEESRASSNGRAPSDGDETAIAAQDETAENDLQSKPRRRGRRGGRRRSAAKANDTPEQPQPVSSDGA